jgi:hypothetical protein
MSRGGRSDPANDDWIRATDRYGRESPQAACATPADLDGIATTLEHYRDPMARGRNCEDSFD